MARTSLEPCKFVLYRGSSSHRGLTKAPGLEENDNILRKQAYSNNTENFTTKIGQLSDKNSDIFRISAQNIDCGTR